jgi:hypothetical protein
LSDSLGITNKLFKGLIRRHAGVNDLNPFSKGAMSFDDYSYKYFNDHVFLARLMDDHDKTDIIETDEEFIVEDERNLVPDRRK